MMIDKLKSIATEEEIDNAAVDEFCARMKEKMAVSRAKGRGGWYDPTQCTDDRLATMLVEHVVKGDPVDIANFAMMLHKRATSPEVLRKALLHKLLG